MSDEPLHRRLEAMDAGAIVESFPRSLAHDLLDQGFTPEDADYARQAAQVVLEICGVMAPAPMRRRKAQASSIEAAQQTRAATMERKRQAQQPDYGPLSFDGCGTSEPGSEGARQAA